MFLVTNRKRWVTPSFDSFVNDDLPPAKKTTGKKVSLHTAQSAAPGISVRENSSSTWLDKYQPKTIDELVIHPKKVKEIEDWFCKHQTNQREKYLILVGPCGCGKTVSLRAVARKFDLDVTEWVTPLDRDFNADLHGDEQTYQSAAEVFEQFLTRASRYPSLLSVQKSKIILVKDFPNIFLQKPEIFHGILRKYSSMNTYPVAFVCNDDNLVRSLLPDFVRNECNMHTIKFNPVHCQAVLKALERVLNLERKFNPNANIPENIDLEAVYQSSAGDLRSAILKLYFNVRAVDGVVGVESKVSQGRTVRTKQKGKRGAKSKNGDTKEATDKDSNIDLFHLLGRVLYSNRQYTKDSGQEYRFVHNPNELVDTCSCQPSSFISFLQENYASRFSCIKSISKAANKLSFADVLLSNINKETDTTALSVAIRGLMVANDKPVKSFKPFVKAPSSEDVLKTSFADEIRVAFPNFLHSPRDIVLYTLPLLKNSSFQFNDSQTEIVNKLSRSFWK